MHAHTETDKQAFYNVTLKSLLYTTAFHLSLFGIIIYVFIKFNDDNDEPYKRDGPAKAVFHKNNMIGI